MKSARMDWVFLGRFDTDLHIAQMKIQVDEMYRKFRWQSAPDGPYPNPLIYELCSASKRMLNEAKEHKQAVDEQLINGCKKLQAQGVPLSVEEILAVESYRDMALSQFTEEDTVKAWQAEAEILQKAYLIELYHTKVLENVDINQPRK